MRDILRRVQDEYFEDFMPTVEELPSRVSVIGDGGEFGGKAKGAVVDAVLKEASEDGIAGEYSHLVDVPMSTVVLTCVFDDFMADNNLWPQLSEVDHKRAQQLIEAGDFRPEVREALKDLVQIMDYPLAVRSSSTFEDNRHHPTSGLYLTLFTANRGSVEERLLRLESMIKRIYASMFGPEAVAYRKRARLAGENEKMAILIQQLIGNEYGRYFLPSFAGVGFSRNYYRWSNRLKTRDAVIRLVCGLGVRAVEGDYARLFSVGLPDVRPEGQGADAILRSSQKMVTVLDREDDEIISVHIDDLLRETDADGVKAACSLYDPRDMMLKRMPRGTRFTGAPRGQRPVITFADLVKQGTPLVEILKEVVERSEKTLAVEADCEFAVTVHPDFGPNKPDALRLYKVQTRPLGARRENRNLECPPPEQFRQILLTSNRIIGNGVINNLDRLVYVDPDNYLSVYNDKERLGKLIWALGKINQEYEGKETGYLLMGPGRWGTRNRQSGVPVAYGDISNASVVVECITPHFVPVFSYGNHFFKNLFLNNNERLVFYFQVNLEKDRKGGIGPLLEESNAGEVYEPGADWATGAARQADDGFDDGANGGDRGYGGSARGGNGWPAKSFADMEWLTANNEPHPDNPDVRIVQIPERERFWVVAHGQEGVGIAGWLKQD